MYVYVDFDGVLADTAVLKRTWVANATGREINASFDRSTLLPLIGTKIYSAMQSDVGYEDTLLAPPMVGALSALRQLSEIATIIVVSARPPEKMVWVRRWLSRHGLEEEVQCVTSAYACTKSDIVRQYGGGWLIDDDLRHAAGMPTHTTFVLFGRPREESNRVRVCASDWEGVKILILGGRSSP